MSLKQHKSQIRARQVQVTWEPSDTWAKLEAASRTSNGAKDRGYVPIFKRSKKELDDLECNELEELTKNLTAEEWNKFLQKWHNDGEEAFDPHPIIFLTVFDEKKGLKFMKDA